jgi:nitrogen fixation NifU-like protein
LAYSEIFRDHVSRPRNAGELAGATVVEEATNPVCGDRLQLYLLIREDKIEQARFLAYGCAATIACGSVLTELLQGTTVGAALELSRKDLADSLHGLPARKGHAAALAIETLHRCLSQE